MRKENSDEYNMMKETIAFGGHVNIDGKDIDNQESLDYHYSLKTEDNNNSI